MLVPRLLCGSRHLALAALALGISLWMKLQMLYLGLGAFVGTSLALAVDAFAGFRLPYLPTGLAVVGVVGLLVASVNLGREVVLSVRSFDRELDAELARRRR